MSQCINVTICITWRYSLLPVSAVDASWVVHLPLAEVDQVGVEKDAHRHQDDQQPQLLVRLLQCVEQGLEPSEMADKLEDSEGESFF